VRHLSQRKLNAKAHQRRAARNLAEADDAGKSVQGNTQAVFVFNPNQNGLTLFGKIRSLGGDVESVQQLFHGSFPVSAMAAATALLRYLRALFASVLLGRQME
jgi:hypothetical protein